MDVPEARGMLTHSSRSRMGGSEQVVEFMIGDEGLPWICSIQGGDQHAGCDPAPKRSPFYYRDNRYPEAAFSIPEGWRKPNPTGSRVDFLKLMGLGKDSKVKTTKKNKYICIYLF